MLQAVDLNLTNLSLAYLMTGDARYGDPAKRILLRLADWSTDDSDVTSVSARSGDEIGLSVARCAHRAYDWLHDGLSEDERKKVLAMCEQRAWQAYRRLKRHDYLRHPGDSHNGRLVAYLVEMAIVMAGESEGAKSWLAYSLKALTTVLPHWGDDEGGWSEGPAYGVWQNQSFVSAFEALRIATGFDLWQRPGIRRFPYFLLYCSALRATWLPFGDGAEREGPGSSEESAYGSLMRHFAHRFGDPTLGWAAQQAKPALEKNRELSLLFEDVLEARTPSDLPNARVFEAVGLAALHSDLSRPEEDTFLLFRSSPRGSSSKSHADQNGFCILKGGTPLAIPSGYDGPAAGMPHHFEWTHSTKASNCVLVGGQGQAIQEQRARGRIVAFEDRRGLSYVAGDASEAYMGRVRRFVRHVLFLRPGLFILLDELETPEPCRFQWMLHSLEQFEIDAAAGEVISRRAGAALTLRLRSSAGLSLRQTDQFDTPYNTSVSPGYRVDVPDQWHLTAETLNETGAVRITASMAVSGPRERFAWEPIEHPGWLGARATSAAGTAEGWAQIRAGAPGPPGYAAAVAAGRVPLCGRDARGAGFEISGSDDESA